MKRPISAALPSSLLLGAALTLALAACSRSEQTGADTAAAPAQTAAPATTASAAPTDGTAMAGDSAASMEMKRVMDEAKAMPMTMSGDIDKDFASMMTMHHQTAIKMIDAYLPTGQAAELKALATKMRADQQEEIKKLEPFANAAAAAAAAPMPGHEGMAGMEGQGAGAAELHGIMEEGKKMEMPMSGTADKDFATMMTMHHQMAIRMIEVHQKSGKAAELKALGAKMKSAQQAEIEKMAPFKA